MHYAMLQWTKLQKMCKLGKLHLYTHLIFCVIFPFLVHCAMQKGLFWSLQKTSNYSMKIGNFVPIKKRLRMRFLFGPFYMHKHPFRWIYHRFSGFIILLRSSLQWECNWQFLKLKMHNWWRPKLRSNVDIGQLSQRNPKIHIKIDIISSRY